MRQGKGSDIAPEPRTEAGARHQPYGKTSPSSGAIFTKMLVKPSPAEGSDPRNLRRLAAERALIDLLFARLAENVEHLQPKILQLHRACFFSQAARLIDEIMAVRIPLATLGGRLERLCQDYQVSEDSPRFLFLESTVRVLAADALRTLAARIAEGQIVPPLGTDDRLRTWADILDAPEFAEEPAYAEAAAILRQAADALPQIRHLA